MENWRSVARKLNYLKKSELFTLVRNDVFHFTNVTLTLQAVQNQTKHVMISTLMQHLKDFEVISLNGVYVNLAHVPNSWVHKFVQNCNGHNSHCKRSTDFTTALTHLNLFYVYCHKLQRSWTLYHLKGTGANYANYRPEDVEAQLQNKLKPFRVCTAVHIYDGAYWIIVVLKPKKSGGGKQSVSYFVYHRQRPLIATYRLLKEDSSKVLKVLTSVFQFEEAHVTDLKGRNLDELYMLFEKQCFSGGRGVHKSLRHERRCKRESDFVIRKKHDRQQTASPCSVFGNEEKPIIQKLTYDLHTRFGGLQHVPKMQDCQNQSFNCQVVFRGPDVYKGIQEMVTSGLTTGPLPKYLTDAHKLGSTRIVITNENI